ncbi:hypothetical protein [Lentzea tibetensis]|uniref:hypothetical protein n=1 Tax=Lentzea tibetensis TaxID=2591470 RepID=UPI0016490D85|nr:hypothetical protein [Lentzea tibetensis]
MSDVAPQARGHAWLALTALALVYGLACWAFPYGKCRPCKGMGRFHGGLGGIRLCKRCDGSGLKLRAGRKFLNSLRRHARRGR